MYLIYAKNLSSKRFRPVDLENNVLVTKKFYATMWSEKETAQKVNTHLNDVNPGWEFQVRRA